MDKTLRTIRLFPAIGPDLEPERARLVETVERLNHAAFHASGLHVEVWPALDAAPGLHAAGPHALLDEALADEAIDIVVIAAWNRLRADGAAPLDDAIDGILTRWQQTGHPRVLVYRCDRDLNLATREALLAKMAVVDLFERLARFGQPAAFKDPVEFERHLYTHLLTEIPCHFAVAHAPPIEAAEPEDLAGFLNSVITECGALPLRGLLGDKAAADLKLDDVYVSLYTERPAADRREGIRPLFGRAMLGALGDRDGGPLLEALNAVPKDTDAAAAEPTPEVITHLTAALLVAGAPDDEARRPEVLTALWRRLLAGPRSASAIDRALRTVCIEDALRRDRHLLIEGDPGAGKTTTLHRVALSLARARALAQPGDAADAEAMGFRTPFPLPLFVPLRHFWAKLRELTPLERARADAATLTAFLAERFGAWVTPALQRGSVAILLDGLDEVADSALRKRTAHIVAGFARAHDACRFILTSRPAGLDDTVARTLTDAGGLTHTRVAPLDREQIGRFVTAWYRAMVRDPATAARKAAALLGRIDRNREIAELAETPILLTAIAIVHQTGDLPERRAVLYERCVQSLAHMWDWHKDEFGRELCAELKQDQKIAILMDAAWAAHAQGRGDQLIEPGVLAAIVRATLEAAGEAQPGDARCDELIALLAERSGLLITEGTAWKFRHLQFQEFLAGRRAVQLADPVSALGPHLTDPWWWEPTLLGLGFKAEQDCSRAHTLLRDLAHRFVPRDPPEARVAVSGLMARALIDLRHARAKPGDLTESAARLRDPFMRLVADPSRPGELRHRRLMAEALGWFGDPRLSEAQRWVEVKPARFWTGTVPGDPDHKRYAIDWEHPGRWHEPLPHAFHLQRWPVTVGEYMPFVESGGYRHDDWWDDEPWLTRWRRSPEGEPAKWDEQRRRSPNTPVVGINWYEARAWCRWRDHQPGRPAGMSIRLPSELEWECAARAVGARTLYPWGDEAPTSERAAYRAGREGEDPEAATPVGLYAPGGRGLWDMAGNVWEWCHDDWLFGEDRQSRWLRQNGHDPARVLRGGGWRFDPGDLRVSGRLAERPVGRDGLVGFRCVSAPGPWPP